VPFAPDGSAIYAFAAAPARRSPRFVRLRRRRCTVDGATMEARVLLICVLPQRRRVLSPRHATLQCRRPSLDVHDHGERSIFAVRRCTTKRRPNAKKDVIVQR